MQIVKWIIAFVCFTQAVWLSGFNWYIFWKIRVRKEEAPSWIPLIGGGLGAIGVAIMPIPGSVSWFWVPLLLDWGCFLGIFDTLMFHLLRILREKKS